MTLLDWAFWADLMDTFWADVHQPLFWVGVLQIIWVNILLSGDNAVVIALACRALPPRQRVWGMTLGAAVAVVLRIVFTLIVSTLMELPYLKLAGGLALLYISIKLLVPDEHNESEIHQSRHLWRAVRIVAFADLIMSLDNVIAIAAAAKGSALLLIIGLAISIPLIVAGAALIMSMLNHFPILVWAGAALLGWIAGDLVGNDPAVLRFLADRLTPENLDRFSILTGILGIFIVVAVGWVLRRRHLARLERSAAERA